MKIQVQDGKRVRATICDFQDCLTDEQFRSDVIASRVGRTPALFIGTTAMSCTDSKAIEQATVMPPMRCPQVNSDLSQC